ncbi:MAG: glucose 1-dehydrogenase [Chloroflexi bacterium]|nr:glucose 1-dehydrogenase [Chloroflexota bacterium]MDA1226673.1 glucose 1-dehydrogenase [Chloroflexota bacterium]
MRLEGKVALLSGGAGGIGTAEARLFAREGAAVVVGDLNEEQGGALAEEIVKSGGRAVFVRLDVLDEASWQAAVDTAVQTYGKLNVLVNNAGITRNEGLLDTTEDIWDSVMDVNAKGTFLGCKHAIPEMRHAGGGSIINMSSGAGLVGSPRTTAYHASKGAVRIFTKAVAIQYAPDNIRVNSVHPGPIVTPMLAFNLASAEGAFPPEAMPMGRYGQPEEIAYGVLYLASDESGFVTGSELVIDGGRTAQ